MTKEPEPLAEAAGRPNAGAERLDSKRFGLSGKLLVLTILFVMIAEVLIFVPSIANFRLNWLNDRLAAAHTAALVLDAAPSGLVPESLARQILESVGARAVVVKTGTQRRLLAVSDMPPSVDRDFDMRSVSWFRAIVDAFDTLHSGEKKSCASLGLRRWAAIFSRSCWMNCRCGRRCFGSRPIFCCCHLSSQG
jgi:hypothetical protein